MDSLLYAAEKSHRGWPILKGLSHAKCCKLGRNRSGTVKRLDLEKRLLPLERRAFAGKK